MQFRLEIILDLQDNNSEKIMLSQITTHVDILSRSEKLGHPQLSVEKLISNLALPEYIEEQIEGMIM